MKVRIIDIFINRISFVSLNNNNDNDIIIHNIILYREKPDILKWFIHADQKSDTYIIYI